MSFALHGASASYWPRLQGKEFADDSNPHDPDSRGFRMARQPQVTRTTSMNIETGALVSAVYGKGGIGKSTTSFESLSGLLEASQARAPMGGGGEPAGGRGGGGGGDGVGCDPNTTAPSPSTKEDGAHW